jgi:hypothetical protein
MNFVSQLIGRATSSGSSGAAPSSSSSSSSSSLSNHEHSLRVADSVVGNKVIANTKDGYRSKWNTFKQFLLSNNPLLLNDENEVTIFDRFDNNLLTANDGEVLKAFFGWLSVNTDLPKKQRRARKPTEVEPNEEEDDDDEDGRCPADLVDEFYAAS